MRFTRHFVVEILQKVGRLRPKVRLPHPLVVAITSSLQTRPSDAKFVDKALVAQELSVHSSKSDRELFSSVLAHPVIASSLSIH